MYGVENSFHNGPVKLGFGTDEQRGDLLTAGAEKLFCDERMRGLFFEHAGLSVRPGDTIVVLSPHAMTIKQIEAVRDACDGDLMFQVIGHPPRKLPDRDAIKAFRLLEPVGAEAPMPPKGGRPSKIQYTEQQAMAIIRMWHDQVRKPADIRRDAEVILGVPAGTLKPHWVRDLVIKYVGTAQRQKPDDWNDKEQGDG